MQVTSRLTAIASGSSRNISNAHKAGISSVATRLFLLACLAGFNLVAARVLAPAGRGELAFITNVGYLGGMLVLFGRPRAILTNVKTIPRISVLGATALTINLAAPAIAMLTGASRLFDVTAILAMTQTVALTGVTNAEMLRRRSSNGMIALHGASGMAFLLGVGALLLSSAASPRTWALIFVWCSGIAPLILSIRCQGSLKSAPAVVTADGGQRHLAVGDLGLGTAQRSDRILLGLQGRTELLGRYAVATGLAELVALPVRTAAELRSRSSSNHSRHLEIAAWIVLVLVLGLLVVVGDAVVGKLAGDGFRVGWKIWAALGGSVIAISTYRGASAESLRGGAVRNVVVADVTVGVVAAFVYLLAISRFGMAGAILGTTLGYGAGTAYLLVSRFRN